MIAEILYNATKKETEKMEKSVLNEFNNLVYDICYELNIMRPEIIFDKSKLKTETMMAMSSIAENKIWINPDLQPNDLYFSVAHELRHFWQSKYKANQFLKDYQLRTSTDINSYNTQDAEIDANAYAYTIMIDFYKVRPKFDNLPADVVRQIINAAWNISI